MKYDDHYRISCEKRSNYWNDIGTPFSDVIGNMINPSFMGGPRWPSLRQAHIGIAIDKGSIIATDGLSDPYSNFDSNPDLQSYNGIGVEAYAICEKSFDNIQEVIDSWEFKVLRQVSNTLAANPNISNALQQYNYISSTINGSGLPEIYLSENGESGIILGLENNIVGKHLQLSIEKILLVSVTMLMKDELDYIMKGGAEARNEVAKRLTDKGHFRLVESRQSVV